MDKDEVFDDLHPNVPLAPNTQKLVISIMKQVIADLQNGRASITLAGVCDGEEEYDGMSHYILTTIKTEHSPKEET